MDEAGSHRADRAEQVRQLRCLHRPGRPLVLPNAWDVASARLAEAEGFPTVATSSGAIAASLGHPDNDSMPPDEAFAAVTRIARAVAVPVTADIEAGYGLTPTDIVQRLIAAGAAGCNLEDTDHHSDRELIDVDTQAEFLAKVREASKARDVDLVINARVDVFRTKQTVTADVFEEAIRRATAYVEAGADCIYPIRLQDERLIRDFVRRVDAPVNIMLTPKGPSVNQLAAMGVARVSLAGGLMRHAYDGAREMLRSLRQQIPDPP